MQKMHIENALIIINFVNKFCTLEIVMKVELFQEE